MASSRVKARLGFACLIFAALIVSLCLESCKRKPSAGPESRFKAGGEVLDLGSTLVARIPPESFAFFKWDGKARAYERLLQSPWGQGGISLLPKKSDPEAKRLLDVLAAFGLDPEDQTAWRKVFAESVAFAVYTAPENAQYGLVFRPDGIDLAARIKQAREQLPKHVDTIEDMPNGFHFTFRSGAEAKPQSVYVARKDDLGVVSTDKSVLEKVLASPGNALPGFVNSDNFRKAAASLPPSSSRFALGGVDLPQAIARGAAGAAPVGEDAKAFLVLVGAFGMDQAPLSVVRLLYDEAKLSAHSPLRTLGASTSAGLTALAPEKPLLFLSFDGGVVRGLRAAAQSAAPQAPEAAAALSFLDSIERLAILASVAPVAQRMLPLPDVAIVARTKDPQAMLAGLEQLISASMGPDAASSGMAWSDKQVDGHKVRAIMSPLQLGAFLSAKDHSVLITSTEEQMRLLLSGAPQGKFENALGKDAKDIFTSQPNAANLYLDFQELAQLLTNVKGLLSMFAPQAQSSTGGLLEPESLQSLAKKGQMVGWLLNSNATLEFYATYQPPKQR